jgi:hypothetical protein
LRISPSEQDKVGRLTATLMRRNKDWSMEDALNAAKKQLGIKPAAEAAPDPAKPKSDLPETIEAVDQTLESLETDRENALTELRFEDVGKIDRQIRKLDRHRVDIERGVEKKKTEALRDFQRDFAASDARATELYEFAANPESPGGKRMREIEADLKELGDPLYFDANKPLRIAQMVAAEMNIAPRRKGAPVVPAKAAAPTQAPKPKSVLPTGSSRTTVPIQNQTPEVITQVQNVKNVHDLRKVLKGIGIR